MGWRSEKKKRKKEQKGNWDIEGGRRREYGWGIEERRAGKGRGGDIYRCVGREGKVEFD